jgi:MFS family permease
LAVVPINAAYGGIWTLLPLYLLDLGGSVIDVGFASTAFNAAIIPASLFWGYAVDRYGKRKSPMLLATAVIGLVFITMFFISSIPLLVALYAVFAFFTAAFTPITQLLIMELSPKREWPSMFGRVSGASTFGFVLGTAPGVFWTQYFELRSYLIYCALMQIIAFALVARLVMEPRGLMERQAIAFSPEALVHRIRDLPLIFLRIPSVSDFRRFFRMIRMGLGQGVPLLFISMMLFFGSASLFFTSFTPFLKSQRLMDFQVFIVYMLLFATNTVSFFYAGRVADRLGRKRAAAVSILLRGLALFSALALLLISETSQLIAASVVILAVVGMSFTFANTAASMLLFDSLQPGKQGEMLGIYSALTGTGLLIGAFASGFLSFHLGYAVTFIAAGLVVLISLAIFRRSAEQL